MTRPGRAILVAALVSLALVHTPAAPAEGAPDGASDAGACADLRDLPGVGPVCARGPGLYEVYAPSGRSLGFTHGPDPVCEGCDGVVAADEGNPPHCVTAGGGSGYYVHVIYARASNDADNYAATAGTIRELVASANSAIAVTGQATGSGLDLRALCDASGTLVVENAVLPTSRFSATFSTIVSDLEDLGFDSTQRKYWVYYDDTFACSCAGTGHIYFDETATATNLNNGNAASPMFAVSFGYASTHVWLHELTHTLGGVQDSAPFSTEAGHCVDGLDFLCYNDGGPNGPDYSTGHCATMVFDCGSNTYCHAAPAAGSWLATHWNVCGANQRFLERGPLNVAPVMQSVTCSPSPADEGETVTCTFHATDPGNTLSYRVDWGDGATTRVPTTGYVASGAVQSASHAFATGGSFSVAVTATDDQTPLTSPPMSRAVEIVEVNTAPDLRGPWCPATLQPGATATCWFRAFDDSVGVRYRVDWGDGETTFLPAAEGSYLAPGTNRSAAHAYPEPGAYTVSVTAVDDAAQPLSSATQTTGLSVANAAPVMRWLSCPASLQPGASAMCTFHATDDSPGVRYRVEWGDGQTSLVPGASTWVVPGSNRSALHTYTVEGTYVVNVSAVDDSTHPATSDVRSATLVVANEAPTLSLSCTAKILPGGTALCNFAATDDSTGVRYRIEWGDGNVTMLPTTGYLTPGTSRSASHLYPRPGDHLVNVTATDNAATPRSATATDAVRVADDPPDLRSLTCTSATILIVDTATCSFLAADDSSGVRYRIDWGDGNVTENPSATGYVAPGQSRSAQHVYAKGGNYQVRATATDNASPPSTSATRTATIRVYVDTTPPTLALTSPIPGRAYHGCGFEEDAPIEGVLFVQRGCVRATATDDSRMDRVEVRYGGVVLANDTTAPYQIDLVVPETGLSMPYEVRAYDVYGNFASRVFEADGIATRPDSYLP